MRAMNAVVDPRVTFAELSAWPDDGRRYELYNGEVVVVPAPFLRHQRVAARVHDVLREYEEAIGGLVAIAPVDVVLSEHDVVQPDVVFVGHHRKHLVDMMDAIRVPPDLVVEVLSRKTEMRDRSRKADLFARFGIPEYWIVDPVKNTIEIHRNIGAMFVLDGVYDAAAEVRSPTLPGLAFHAARVFVE
jgi:Uma2 family endonuclease